MRNSVIYIIFCFDSNRMQLTLECPSAVIFRHRYQQFVLARFEMNGDLVVKAEHSERTIIPIPERILPRKDALPVQVDDDVVAVTDFEKLLTPLRRRESRPGKHNLCAFHASLAHLLSRRHGK